MVFLLKICWGIEQCSRHRESRYGSLLTISTFSSCWYTAKVVYQQEAERIANAALRSQREFTHRLVCCFWFLFGESRPERFQKMKKIQILKPDDWSLVQKYDLPDTLVLQPWEQMKQQRTMSQLADISSICAMLSSFMMLSVITFMAGNSLKAPRNFICVIPVFVMLSFALEIWITAEYMRTSFVLNCFAGDTMSMLESFIKRKLTLLFKKAARKFIFRWVIIFPDRKPLNGNVLHCFRSGLLIRRWLLPERSFIRLSWFVSVSLLSCLFFRIFLDRKVWVLTV